MDRETSVINRRSISADAQSLSTMRISSKTRRWLKNILLIGILLLLHGCVEKPTRIHVPPVLTDGDTLYLGMTKLQIFQRDLGDSYVEDMYSEYAEYRFFNRINYDMEHGEVAGITLVNDRGWVRDFDSIGALLQREYRSPSRRQVLRSPYDTAIVRVWKIGPKHYAQLYHECCAHEPLLRLGTMMFYIGSHADWDGLPEWE